MKKITIRNVLIVLGCYFLSMWVVFPITLIYGKITSGIIYSGTLGAFFMHIIAVIPKAIVAVGAGILCVYSLVDTLHKKWLLLLSLLYAILHFTGFHWVQEPDVTDRILQGVESIIPAISCYLGGTIAFDKLQNLQRKA